MSSSLFICPVCRSPLTRDKKSYLCGNGHIFDISRDGYVNLLLPNQKHSREPGDSKEMIISRRSFLGKGYYSQLAEKIFSLLKDYSLKISTPDFTILDAGCGEGYYTSFLSSGFASCNTGRSARIFGIDISKDGIRYAARRKSEAVFSVAGIHSIPTADGSFNAVINIFAPFSETEFSRVLDSEGIIISVTPGAEHLYELKKSLYAEVYPNDEEFTLSEGLIITDSLRLKYNIFIVDNEDISNLIKMTPYYHKTSRNSIDSFLNNTDRLDTTVDFIIRVLGKSRSHRIHI